MPLQAEKLVLSAGVLLFTVWPPKPLIAQSTAPTQRPTQQQSQPAQKPSASQPELPNAPSPASSAQEPSLSDLGFTPQQSHADPKLQARLNKRTEMLKIHQRLGLITLAHMAAILITGPMVTAKGRNGQPIREPSNANLDFHARLAAQPRRSTPPRLGMRSLRPRSPITPSMVQFDFMRR